MGRRFCDCCTTVNKDTFTLNIRHFTFVSLIMQGKKQYQEKLFANFQLSDRVPKENFYRRLSEVLDLHFLYKLTEPYYGFCGQKSIDPIVLFRLCLVGYLENIISDRKLIDALFDAYGYSVFSRL